VTLTQAGRWVPVARSSSHQYPVPSWRLALWGSNPHCEWVLAKSVFSEAELLHFIGEDGAGKKQQNIWKAVVAFSWFQNRGCSRSPSPVWGC